VIFVDFCVNAFPLCKVVSVSARLSSFANNQKLLDPTKNQ